MDGHYFAVTFTNPLRHAALVARQRNALQLIRLCRRRRARFLRLKDVIARDLSTRTRAGNGGKVYALPPGEIADKRGDLNLSGRCDALLRRWCGGWLRFSRRLFDGNFLASALSLESP